jgi:ribosomal protein S18 acetylase RimI-like enzyme
MNAKITIDILQEKDIPKIKNLLLDMYMQHAESSLVSKKNLQSMHVEEYVRKTIKDPLQVFFLAKINNDIAGVIRCEIKKTPMWYKHAKEAYIDDLVVAAKHRRKGVATRLIESCIKWGDKKGVKLFSCKIWEFNKASAKLFESAGFGKDFSFYSLRNDVLHKTSK